MMQHVERKNGGKGKDGVVCSQSGGKERKERGRLVVGRKATLASVTGERERKGHKKL